ncbi:hypothetical protein [Streptomyces sp. NPDC060022]|uniref:hypothetical protein n=1 Tax=Streptomyces sp. NPDC060022 TaxID=3347039 RepID=UPI0036A69CEA
MTAVTTTTVTLTETGGPAVAIELDALLHGEDFAVVDIPVRQPLPTASMLETFPKPVMEKALWWEGHILEVLHGLPPGAAPGPSPRPEYGPDRSLTARQRAKAAELTAAGHKVAAQTVANYRRRYQADGVVGLADRRPVRKKREFGSVDDAVVAAMRQAIAEATDASTRRGTFLLWRTAEILQQTPAGRSIKLPSERTFYRLLDKLTRNTHTFSSATTRRSRSHARQLRDWPFRSLVRSHLRLRAARPPSPEARQRVTTEASGGPSLQAIS